MKRYAPSRMLQMKLLNSLIDSEMDPKDDRELTFNSQVSKKLTPPPLKFGAGSPQSKVLIVRK